MHVLSLRCHVHCFPGACCFILLSFRSPQFFPAPKEVRMPDIPVKKIDLPCMCNRRHMQAAIYTLSFRTEPQEPCCLRIRECVVRQTSMQMSTLSWHAQHLHGHARLKHSYSTCTSWDMTLKGITCCNQRFFQGNKQCSRVCGALASMSFEVL